MPTLNANEINGVVRTSEPVWSNLERLSEASTAWFTYNTHNGLYGHVINEAGNSVASITEADIIGPIQISGSGLTNLYNAIEIEYPRNDMRDQPHYATLQLPTELRNEYEPDNTLQISSEFINNQPQAEHYGMITLKQSRLDLTVTIVMDYTKINLQAGDIIDITSSTYGWTNKEFRIMRVREIEGDDGSLRLEFSSTEYDDTIYSGTWNNFLVAGESNIRSIGAIGTPGTPTIVLTTKNSLPAQTVTTTVPEGVVDRMQFWAGNVSITSNVANTNFNLVGSVASTNANAFTQSGNVVFTSTGLTDGTWAWKTRGVNGDGVGPYSTVSSNVAYVRTQVTDAIGNSTGLLDGAGNAIATLLAVGTVIKGLDTFLNGNSNVSAAVSNVVTSGPAFQNQLSQGYQYSVNAGKITAIIAQSANANAFSNFGSSTFTIPASIGNTLGYKIDVVADQNSSGAIGGRGSAWTEDEDTIKVSTQLFDITGGGNVTIISEGSGGVGAFFWTDFVTVGFANLAVGNTYKIEFGGVNFTESNPTANCNVTFGWNVFTNNNASF